MEEPPDPARKTPLGRRLSELATLFLRLGVTAFGGPAAHIAMMEEQVVRKRQWLSAQEFLDLLGATNLIPGPNSTEMAIHIGRKRAGIPGLLVAGASFIVPASLITLGFAWAYVRFGRLPRVSGVLYGVKPVIIAVVVQALFALGKSALGRRPRAVLIMLILLAVLSAAASFAGVSELLVLVSAGILSMLLARPASEPSSSAFVLGSGGPALAASVSSATVGSLFLVFAKIGAVLFGSGYVLLAFLRAELVQRKQWLTEAQLVDAVAAGQLTPGPVFTTATFVGYLIRGVPGALAATVGIFLPAFVFVAMSGFLVPKLRASKAAGAFLDGVNVASLALMGVVTFQLGRASLVDAPTVLLALLSALALLRFKVSSVWLILGGALVGWMIRRGTPI